MSATAFSKHGACLFDCFGVTVFARFGSNKQSILFGHSTLIFLAVIPTLLKLMNYCRRPSIENAASFDNMHAADC